jgi:hypothetical protein
MPGDYGGIMEEGGRDCGGKEKDYYFSYCGNYRLFI